MCEFSAGGRTRWRLVLVLAMSLLSLGRGTEAGQEPMIGPPWFQAELTRLTQGTGRWIADNSPYVSDTETIEAYGTEWRWSLGRAGVTGRLFGLVDGAEVATYWEYRLYWDGAAQQAVTEQFGANGAYGRGYMVGFGEGTLADQTFTGPDGNQWRDLHHAWFEGSTHVTRSYGWAEGAWVPRRTYRWELES